MFTYSPSKNIANGMPEYSVWNPATSSDSASARSNGGRFDLGERADQEHDERRELRDRVPDLGLRIDDLGHAQVPANISSATSARPIATS